MSRLKLVPLVVILLFVAVSPAFAASSSTSLPNGASLSVSLDSPLTSTEYLIASGDTGRDVPISGTAGVGTGDPDVTLVYVIDVSFSTHAASGGSCGGDVNGDGASNEVLDCEAAAILALNSAAVSGGSVDEVGVAVYGETGASADMTSTAGDQIVTAPDAGSNVQTVVSSVKSPDCDAGVGQFTNKIVGCDGTDFSAGLAAATSIVNASSNGHNIVIFLSDGESNEEEGPGFASRLSDLQATGADVHAFAVGSSSSCTGGTNGRLIDIDAGCQAVSATDLPVILPDLVSSSLDSVDVTVDGSPVSVTTSIPLPAPGAVSVNWDATAPDLAPGDHVLCATASGHDSAGSDTTDEACETIHVYQLSLAPENEVNELGTPGQTHTVTATLAGPLGGLAPVSGRNIDFTILSGPNAGAVGVSVTDASGDADFTYVAAQGLAGLGTDVIEACVTLNDPLGETGCETVTKEWADTTPPEFACTPTTNPSGKKIPPASNEDGFWELTATDAVDPNPQIFVVDSGSGTVFGPFASGTKIKYTETPGGNPRIKPMTGDIDWHIFGTGDMTMYAVDASGNAGSPVACLVPPPPK